MGEKCNDRKCDGEVDFGRMIRIGVFQERCRGMYKYGYPCKKCGLLHSKEMANFFQTNSNQVLYLKEEELVLG